MLLTTPLDAYIREIQIKSKLIRSGIKKLAVPESTTNTLNNMEVNLNNILYDINNNETAKTLSHEIIRKICSQSKNIAKQLLKSEANDNVKSAATKLLELSETLAHRKNIDAIHTKTVFTNIEELETNQNSYFSVLPLHESDNSKSLEIKKQLEESEAKIYSLSQNLLSLETRTQEEIKKILLNYEKAATDIDLKSSEINNILGKLSGRAIAGDYEKSAASERRIADYLRGGSLFFMGFIAIALIYTFFETTNTEFNWQKSLFRISLTFLLSVPAAYLARESAKHREQQYNHLQTSLDLKAIPPFLSTLPEEEQNRFKLDIANRIFGARETKPTIDSYPINTQEIIMALIKKVEDFAPTQKRNQNQDQSKSG